MYGLYNMIFCIHNVLTKRQYVIYTKILLAICGMEKLYISGADKICFVYIKY